MTASKTTGEALALLGGKPVRPLSNPSYPVYSERARARVDELLAGGHAVGLGKHDPVIAEAETTLADWHGVDHCLTTASGHAALHAALIGLEITGGDEVLTSPFSWGASISCILHNNAIPRFADVDPETGLLDPVDLPVRVTPRTRAILVPHIFGQPANMTAIARFARERGLALIEDGSQAHGARHQGRRVGGFGDAAGFSCMGGKLLATTEGGYLVTRRAGVYHKAVLAGQHGGTANSPGRRGEPGFPEELLPYSDSLIYTHRISVLSAVLMVEQLRKLEDENAARRRNRERFVELLAGVGSVRFPQYPAGDVLAPHMVTMSFVPEHAGVSKETYIAALRAEGVPAYAYLKQPLHMLDRLSPDTAAPRVMWTENLRRAGVDYRGLELPGTAAKTAASIELSWNHIVDDPATMAELADGFAKVEQHLDDLRAHERARGS
jgi:dTDP-4-amino-4,6-dideoxygalactose transaminase